MLAVIGQKLAAADLPHVTAVKLDLVADPPPGDPFDLAVSFLVLHHIEDTAAALAAVRRLLRPGGRMALSDLDTEDGTFHSAEAEGIHHLGFDRRALAELARDGRVRRGRDTVGDATSQDEDRRFPAFLLLGRQPLNAVATGTIEVVIEATPKKAFAWAIDWPGWCTVGQDRGPRARGAWPPTRRATPSRRAEAAGRSPGAPASELRGRRGTGGGGGTDFGVPSVDHADSDRRPVTAAEAERLARARRGRLDRLRPVAAAAPAELRKGPRGGGRDRDKMVAPRHRIRRVLRPRDRPPRAARPVRRSATVIEATRAAMLEVLGRPSDGSPLAGRKWPPRYAARRIAWHALDHAWEMEDRTRSPLAEQRRPPRPPRSAGERRSARPRRPPHR